MGYTTVFKGSFTLQLFLNEAQRTFLLKLSQTRRMKRNPERLTDIYASAVGLTHLGTEGEFFVGGAGFAGQEHTADNIDHNNPPGKQPGLWCHWIPNADGSKLEWDGGEKFYEYVEWLRYIISNFLRPWGISGNGQVLCSGEHPGDVSMIRIANGKVNHWFLQPKDIEERGEELREMWSSWHSTCWS